MKETRTKHITVNTQKWDEWRDEKINESHVLESDGIYQVASLSNLGDEGKYFLYNKETKEKLFGREHYPGFTLLSEEEMSKQYKADPTIIHPKMEATLKKQTEKIIKENLFHGEGFLVIDGLNCNFYYIGVEEGDFGVNYSSWVEKN